MGIAPLWGGQVSACVSASIRDQPRPRPTPSASPRQQRLAKGRRCCRGRPRPRPTLQLIKAEAQRWSSRRCPGRPPHIPTRLKSRGGIGALAVLAAAPSPTCCAYVLDRAKIQHRGRASRPLQNRGGPVAALSTLTGRFARNGWSDSSEYAG